MDRYRSSYPLDDPSINDGDNSLVGTDYYTTPENLQPGLYQAATNCDFTTMDAVTRGGFVCLPELGNTPFGQVWVATSPASASSWVDVNFGNNLFVAVGGPHLMSSPDGRTWTTRSIPSTPNLADVAWGNGVWVAVGSTTGGGPVPLFRSTDGITWTIPVTAPASTLRGVAYGNDLWVAIGPSRSAVSSDNGLTWTNTTGIAELGTFASKVTYGNGLFVAITTLGDVVTSADGISWTVQSVPVTTTFADIAYGAGLYVILGFLGITLTSPDGVVWNQRSAANGNTWRSLVYGGGVFIAVSSDGSGNQVMSSLNGTVWLLREDIPSGAWFGVTFGNSSYVAVGTNVSMILGTGGMLVFASGRYSDPNDTANPWIVLAAATQAGFFSFGQTSFTINYPVGFTLSEQSCIVQANNYLFIFGGPDVAPIYWDGFRANSFIVVPPSILGVGFMSIPESNSALYYQNRLWVVDGKDTYAASNNLGFTEFNDLTDVFNLNVGTSDYLVTSYPFGNNSIVVFKNHSSYLLQNVSGDLTDVTSTEITRQLGIVGINAVTAVGPDIVYVSSDRNITTVRLNIQNATQAVTVPLSRNINPLMQRVNWAYASKISVGYWNNLLFVALPFDNATVCNTVLVYNFITNQWYGEWNFAASMNMAIQGWVTANYLGQIRMHAISEDGRIFVVDEGHQDISGTTLADISMSVTSRSYVMDNNNRFNRRMYADLSTNRANYSITGYVDGVSESSALITNQTYLRSQSFLFPSPAYQMNNSDDDYMQAFRKDYAALPSESIQPQSGFLPESTQDFRIPLIFRRNGRLVYYRISNTTGTMIVNGLGGEARAGYRSSLIQAGN